MAKVSDMIGDYADPAGNMGRDVPQVRAEYVAAEMRQLLELIYRFDCVVDKEEQIAAWQLLNAMERAAWAKVVQARGREYASQR